MVATSGFQTEWQRIRLILKTHIGDAAFDTWIQSLTFVGFEDSAVILGAETSLIRDWVQAHYLESIEDLFQQEHPLVSVVIKIVSHQSTSTPLTEAPLEARFTFSNFIVGKPNELAYAASRRVAESPKVQFNPLFLYGGVGLGKTHLMHAISHHIQTEQPSRKVIYLSAEKFMYQFVRALRYKDTMAFKERFRSVDVLMVDDVQFIGGKESTQEEFFHTFNALVDGDRQVIISADKSPSDLKEDLGERLCSRLGWGLVVDVHPTTYELRLSILQSKKDFLSVPVPRKVLEFLAHKITSNVRELEGALTRVVAHSTLVGREINLEMAQEILGDVLKNQDRVISLEVLQRRVAEHYKIRVSEMFSLNKSRHVARPRQVAMFLAKKFTSLSLPEIGRQFGHRDHSTVLHGVRRIEELIVTDSKLNEDVQLLSRSLNT